MIARVWTVKREGNVEIGEDKRKSNREARRRGGMEKSGRRSGEKKE